MMTEEQRERAISQVEGVLVTSARSRQLMESANFIQRTAKVDGADELLQVLTQLTEEDHQTLVELRQTLIANKISVEEFNKAINALIIRAADETIRLFQLLKLVSDSGNQVSG